MVLGDTDQNRAQTMSPKTEEATELELARTWHQTFPTDDGIFARHSSALALVETESQLNVYLTEDRTKVIVEEQHDRGVRRFVADRLVVMSMRVSLATGRLPYRFVMPDEHPETALAVALQREDVHTENAAWGPQLIDLNGEQARRIRSIFSGPAAFLIVESGNEQPLVYSGSRSDFDLGGLFHGDKYLTRLI